MHSLRSLYTFIKKHSIDQGKFSLAVNVFIQQVEAMYQRLAHLHHQAATRTSGQLDVLPAVFKELGVISERLQMAVKQLHQQQEELSATKAALAEEHQRYQDLFEFAPEAYVITDRQGVIQQANRAAVALLKTQMAALVGKPLTVLMPEAERREFRTRLHQIGQTQLLREWQVRFLPRVGEMFTATLSVTVVNHTAGEAGLLRWLLRGTSTDQTGVSSDVAVLAAKDFDPCQDRPIQHFTRGEIISFHPQTIWQVCQGLVKLSTFTERGEEVLIGLAGPAAPFGPALTNLPFYQAVALSDVEVVGISLTELLTSPASAQVLFPHVSQRLKQSESLLAVSGQRRVSDRLQALLQLLKQEVGERVANGTRLTVRLRHEDLANACCTTRVTVTRLLSELQQQGQISLDAKHHLILHD